MLHHQKSYLDLFAINWAKSHKFTSLVFAGAAIILLSSWSKLYHFVNDNASLHLAMTHHQLRLDNQMVHYKTSAGYLPVNDSNNKPLANIFYVEYTAGG